MAYCLDSNYFRIFFPNNVLLCLCLFLISRPSHQFHQLCHFFNFFISLIISFFRIGTVHVSVSSTVCFFHFTLLVDVQVVSDLNILDNVLSMNLSFTMAAQILLSLFLIAVVMLLLSLLIEHYIGRFLKTKVCDIQFKFDTFTDLVQDHLKSGMIFLFHKRT